MNKLKIVASLLLAAFFIMSQNAHAGNRINPGADEGARPMEYRTTVYVDQNYPLPITGAGDLTITQPGWYALANKITGTINISSDYVTLEGRGYEIDGNIQIAGSYVTIDLQGGWISTAFDHGIYLSGNFSNIVIENGTIDGGDYGIYIRGCAKVMIKNMFVYNCAVACFDVFDSNEMLIEQCTADKDISRGFYMANSGKISLCDCIARASKILGYALIQSSDILVLNCKVSTVATQGDDIIYGFAINGSNNIMLDSCIVEDIYTSGYGMAFGYSLGNTSNIVIKNCLANNVKSTNNNAYGIFCNYFLLISNCAIIDNIIGNVSGTNAGVGIQGYDYMLTNNVVARNICYQNNTNYAGFSSPALDVQSGYPGVNFMYNVALPTE